VPHPETRSVLEALGHTVTVVRTGSDDT
jgi:hypothetical protein